MLRRGLKPGIAQVLPRPGAHEKEKGKDFTCPYQEPGRVPLAEKAKA